MKKLLFCVGLLAAPVAADETAPFDWKLNPEANSKWTVRSFQRIRMTQLLPMPAGATGPGSKAKKVKMELNSQSKSQVNWEVLSKDEAGSYKVVVSYGDMSSSSEVKIDGKPMPSNEKKLIMENDALILKALKGIKYNFTISKEGKVTEVEGVEKFAAAFKAELKKVRPNLDGPVDGFLTKLYSKETLETLFGLGSGLPSGPLKLGDSYNFKQGVEKVLPYNVVTDIKRTFVGRTGELVSIDDTGIISSATGAKPMAMGPLKIGMKLTGTVAGKSQVTESTGLLANSSGQLRMQGEATVSGPNVPKGTTIQAWIVLESNLVQERQALEPGGKSS